MPGEGTEFIKQRLAGQERGEVRERLGNVEVWFTSERAARGFCHTGHPWAFG